MGATTQVMTLRGLRTGQTYSLSCYFAGGDAAGYLVPCTFNGAAVSTSPTDFTLPEECQIMYMSGPATGTLTIDSDGMATPIKMNMAQIIAQANNPNLRIGGLRGNGKRYRIRVEIAMAA